MSSGNWKDRGRGILGMEVSSHLNFNGQGPEYAFAYRVDARDALNVRLDLSVNGGAFEAIDEGDGFDSREAAVCWGVKHYGEVRTQKTITPRMGNRYSRENHRNGCGSCRSVIQRL